VKFTPINYKSIVFSQSAAGFWNSGLLEMLDGITSMAELRALQTDETVKSLNDDLLLTVIAIKILKTRFTGNIKEWRLVAAKGVGYLKKSLGGASSATGSLDSLMEKVVFSTLF
jgi:hypothetical protein